jgi:hypothetical protein
MISLTALAVAGTLQPADLAAAMPSVHDQLHTCAVHGCSDEAGAEAAFLLAVHTYVASGVADGALAATVRELDPARFADLPDVIQRAATAPAAWVTGQTEPEPVSQPQPVPLQASIVSDPKAITLTVHLRTPSGDPAEGLLAFAGEQSVHRIGVDDAQWTGSTKTLTNGSQATFRKGDVVEFLVWAPDHSINHVTYVVSRRKRQDVHVVLTTEPMVRPTLSSPAAERATEAWGTMVAAERRYFDGEADPNLSGIRRDAAEAARAWLDEDGGRLAHQLCVLAGSSAACGPWR